MSQVFPTTPKNVFRVSFTREIEQSRWQMSEQGFELSHIGKMFFNHEVQNKSGYFSYNRDLYHLGNTPIDTIETIESWLNRFNEETSSNLPLFESGYLDTDNSIFVGGQFLEQKKRKIRGRKLNIAYGMSDNITISLDVPILDRYTLNQSFSGTGNRIEGINEIVTYLQNAKLNLEKFINSDKYFFMRKGLRDTVQMIYDNYFSSSGENSVIWAIEMPDDPLNQGFTDTRFFDNTSLRDTVNLNDLIDYYYPSKKTASGLGDIKMSFTILLRGSPSWSEADQRGAIYGRLEILLPYGYTIGSYLSEGKKQFKKFNLGKGITRWSPGIFGEYLFNGKMRPRIFGNLNFTASTPEFLYTPVNLFSASHTHPDSIVAIIGEDFKFKEGNFIRYNIGFDFEPKPDRIRVRIKTNYVVKSRDSYLSNDKNWDRWMQSHEGYDSKFSARSIFLEGFVLNSISKNRVGPFSFNMYTGLKKSIFSRNTFDSWKFYWGVNFYLQSW